MVGSFRFVARPALLAAAVLSLSGCGLFGGGGKNQPAPAATRFTGTEDTTETATVGNGDGLNMPLDVEGFHRRDVQVGEKIPEATVNYTHASSPTVEALIHLHAGSGGGSFIPFSGDGSDAATKSYSDAALTASIAAVTRAHPEATVSAREDVFVVRFGTLQAGRAAMVNLTDTLGGQSQPVQVLLESFCCVNGKWAYDYRFEAPAGVDARLVENAFLRAVAWSRDPNLSVEEAQ